MGTATIYIGKLRVTLSKPQITISGFGDELKPAVDIAGFVEAASVTPNELTHTFYNAVISNNVVFEGIEFKPTSYHFSVGANGDIWLSVRGLGVSATPTKKRSVPANLDRAYVIDADFGKLFVPTKLIDSNFPVLGQAIFPNGQASDFLRDSTLGIFAMRLLKEYDLK